MTPQERRAARAQEKRFAYGRTVNTPPDYHCRRFFASLYTIDASGSPGSPPRAHASPVYTGRYEGEDRGEEERAARGSASGEFGGGRFAEEAGVEGWVARSRGVRCSRARFSAGADSTRPPLLRSATSSPSLFNRSNPASIFWIVTSCLRSISRGRSWTAAPRFMLGRSAVLGLCNRI